MSPNIIIIAARSKNKFKKKTKNTSNKILTSPHFFDGSMSQSNFKSLI